MSNDLQKGLENDMGKKKESGLIVITSLGLKILVYFLSSMYL